MKPSRKFLKKISLTATLSAFAALQLPACPACGSANGDMPSSPLTDGMNLGILTLFAVIITVLGSIAGFFVYIIRRETALAGKVSSKNPTEIEV